MKLGLICISGAEIAVFKSMHLITGRIFHYLEQKKMPSELNTDRSAESGEATLMSGERKSPNEAEDRQESCTVFPSPEVLQRKYKCLIIYAISFISIIELILLMFNSESSSSKSFMDVLARYVNRTQTMM